MPHFRAIVALLLFFVLLSDLSPSFAQSESQSLAPVVDPATHRTPSVCMLYHFGTDPNDPLWPDSISGLVEAKDGTIYGAGSNGACANCHGRVFKMTPDGKFEIVHIFKREDGENPIGGLAQGPGDTFYGTTYTGGKVEYTYSGKQYTKYTGTGTIFSVSPGSNGISSIWTFRNNWLRRIGKDDPPHTEKEKKDAPASYPVSPPVTNKAGKTMGVTSYAWNNRFGALYSLDGEYTTVENMDGSKAHKLISLSPGVVDNNFYGTSVYGRKADKKGALFGTIFMTSGGPIKVLHQFNGADGSTPWNVIQGKDGKLYGATYAGGMYKGRHGVIFRLNSDGSGYEILRHLNGAEGSQAASALVWGTDNRLYGTTRFGGSRGHGTLFRIDPDGKNFTVLHNFNMYVNGRAPLGNMIQHSDKSFYGTTYIGGKYNKGGVFRLDAGLDRTLPGLPGGRWCCALTQEAVPGGALEPAALDGHRYGTRVSGDPVGFVYTNRAGLLDLGHVRDMTDLTRFVYEVLMSLDRRKKARLETPEANLILHGYPDNDQEQILRLAGAIAYLDGWAHELVTWDTTTQDFSSFSPEDLVSNVVGITIAQRAIRNHCVMDFDRAVDIEMANMMIELDAQPALRTREVIDSVRARTDEPEPGRWFKTDLPYMQLLRRNFKAWPWLVPFEQVRYRVPWLTDTQYKQYYKYFDYQIKNPVDGRENVTHHDMQRITTELRIEWVGEHPGMDQWPTNPIGLDGPLNSNPDAPGVPGWPEGK